MGPAADQRALQKYIRLSEQVRAMDEGPNAAFTEALKDAEALFASLQRPHCLFGALAVSAYTQERRSTLDIDYVTDDQAVEELTAAAMERNWVPLTDCRQGPCTLSFRHPNGVTVDILCSGGGFVEAEPQTVTLPGVGTVPVARPVDLIVAKLRTQGAASGREPQKALIDRADVLALLRHDPLAYRQARARLAGRQAELRLLQQCAREAGLAADPAPGRGWRRWALAALAIAGALAAWGVWALAGR